MSKHTPGHWEVEKDDKTVVSTADYNIAFVVTLPSKEETTANARLISAAPDMAEALRDLLRMFSDHDDDALHALAYTEPETAEAIVNARAALKKSGVE